MQDFPFNVDAAAVHSDFSSAESPVSEDPSESSGEAVTAAPAPTAPRYQPPRVPRIAIVGRPNVGKSSLMNMLAARRVSIVDNTPGTTRDRVSAIVSLEGENPTDKHIVVEMTDTGGYGVYTVEGRGITNDGHDLAPLGKDVERQIAHAVESADLVLFVIDTQTGVTPQDREVARLLREGGLGGGAPGDAATRKPGKHRKGSAQPLGADGTTPMTRQGSGAGRVIVLCNKCDGPRWEAHAFEAATLGFGEPLVVSAKNNYNRRHLVESLHAAVSRLLASEAATPTGGRAAGAANAPATLPAAAEMHLAIVGKRNAGKSTLVNTLAGEERVIVSEIAGTTRDAVDVRFQIGDRTFVAIDTAGLRKRKSFQDRIEWWALDRCELAIDRASVCLLMIDATVPISSVDKQLGMMIADRFKPVVIVVNKWDLARGKPIADGRTKRGRPRPVDTADYETYIRAELKGLWYAPIAFMSARDNHNVRETIELAFELFQQSQMRTTTGKLNRLVRNILDHQRPASGTGAFAKLLYVAQVAIAPPTIVCVVNHPDLFTPNYQRFLLNRFREELPFTEVPIKLLIRGRRRDEVIETQEGEIARVRDRSEAADLPDAGTDSEELAGGAEPLAAGAPALGLTSDEAETIDWSVEPKSEADRYFDEPLAQPVRRESSGGDGDDTDRSSHARGNSSRGAGKPRKSRPRSGARPQPSDRTKPRMKAAAKARAGAKRGGPRGSQSGSKGRRDGPARGRSSSRG